MKKVSYILSLFFLALSCMDANPYEDAVYTLTVVPQWPQGEYETGAVEVRVEDINTGNVYTGSLDDTGVAEFVLQNGLYRINMSGRHEELIFNASADKIVVSGKDMTVDITVLVSKAGSIVIKEIYCGGCKKLPKEGDYQADQYMILHNNDYNVRYLDGICFGTLSPYNSTGANPWLSEGNVLPDFVPIIQAVWQFPGDGDDFPLQPGEDAVVCLRGAIDHTAEYPLSVNLNRPGYFVCYNSTYFNNTAYHPAPGDQISQDRYIDVVIKTGQANAYTVSNASPALVLFRAEGVTIQEYVLVPDNVIQVPGSNVDRVVKVPFEWVLDAVEVFDGRSSSNQKRLAPSLDAGYVTQTNTFLGRSLMRNVDEAASVMSGYEVLADTNNSLNDFYETEKQSLHE